MPIRHINLKQHHVDRLNRLCAKLELTQPQVVAKALAVLEEKEAQRDAQLRNDK